MLAAFVINRYWYWRALIPFESTTPSASYSWMARRSLRSIQMAGLNHWSEVRVSTRSRSHEWWRRIWPRSWVRIAELRSSKSLRFITIKIIQLNGAISALPVTQITVPSSWGCFSLLLIRDTILNSDHRVCPNVTSIPIIKSMGNRICQSGVCGSSTGTSGT